LGAGSAFGCFMVFAVVEAADGFAAVAVSVADILVLLYFG